MSKKKEALNDTSNTKVLLVDDDTLGLKALKKSIQRLNPNLELITAKNQEQALSVPSYETLLINFQIEKTHKQQLEAAINTLPNQQKEALSLRFKEGLDYEEIAVSTGKSPQTIYNQIHSAIQKLRKALQPIF